MNAKIVAPAGWKLLPVGEEVPHVHREYRKNPDDLSGRKGWEGWCDPRRCRSTMTPIRWTGVWGNVLAYAVPDK